MTEDTPAIKAWKERLARKLASPKHRKKEAEKKLKLLYDRIPREFTSEPDDEWRREYEAAEQEFLRACSEVYAEESEQFDQVRQEDEEQYRRNHPEEVGDQ